MTPATHPDPNPAARPPDPHGAGESALERNLRALARVNPGAARAVASTPARADLSWARSDEGVDVPELGAVALASRRRPLAEAKRVADGVDVRAKASVLVAGFGAGYLVAELSRRLNGAGLVIVYEPDLGLLRAVFDRVDHSAWLATTPLVLITDPDDAAGLSAALTGREGELALGLEMVDHAPSRERLGDGAVRLRKNMTAYVDTVQTAVNTTLVLAATTLRNRLSNLDRYTTCPGVSELAGAARGRPALVVSAGPSLARTIDLLARPGVRERFVIIAAQTVLKPLLSRGIRPHFVTAVDYHEVSRRFYDGLGARDVDGVTLVAEPQVNPAVLEAFPGAIRLCKDDWLDELLGPGLARDMGHLPLAATVAHLAYYLARHLGCDPVALVGQDLGFTDGQYYAAGAAIHDTWACELSEFRTLEMFEWERIKRMGGQLRRATDVHGRPIYTDKQMAAYLDQFQRDFGEDAKRGLTTLDATGGGVRKQHAQPVELAGLIEQELARPMVTPLPAFDPGARAAPNPAVQRRVAQVRSDVREVGRHSGAGADLLRKMKDRIADTPHVNRLIDELNSVRTRVLKLEPAYGLVHRLNQVGSLRRLRADRNIRVEPGLDPRERQRLEIERDLDNVRWIREAADEFGTLLDSALDSLRGSPKPTRDLPPQADPTASGLPAHDRVLALLPVLFHQGEHRSEAGRPFLQGRSTLRLTLERLARCEGLGGAVVLTDDVNAARSAAAGPVSGLAVDFEPWTPDPAWRASVRSARALSLACWRGGLAGASVYDELVEPGAAATVLSKRGADGALLVGGDWCLVDPGLCAALIARRRERPDVHTLCFSQAAPGLCGCVASTGLLRDIAAARAGGAAGASIGGLISYQPTAPVYDPIVVGMHAQCVQVDAALRTPGLRLIPDTPVRGALLGLAMEHMAVGSGPGGSPSSVDFVRHLAPGAAGEHERAPIELTVELCPGRLTSGRRAHWERGSVGAVERPAMATARAIELIEQFAALRPDGVLTLAGLGDPLQHPGVLDVLRGATGLVSTGRLRAVHVRTDLVCDEGLVDRLAESGVDIVSVDLMAETPGTYATLMGAPLFDRARANVARLVTAARSGSAYPRFWVVPRITRCDHNLAEIEDFYDRWTLLAGAAVIDPLPIRIPGERIEPLPIPAPVRAARLASRMTVFSDGSVPLNEHDPRAGHGAPNVFKTPLGAAWRNVLGRRRGLIRTAAEPAGTGRASITTATMARPLVA
jgi:hypothetical protein